MLFDLTKPNLYCQIGDSKFISDTFHQLLTFSLSTHLTFFLFPHLTTLPSFLLATNGTNGHIHLAELKRNIEIFLTND